MQFCILTDHQVYFLKNIYNMLKTSSDGFSPTAKQSGLVLVKKGIF
jgi:hypothetical protein